MADDRPQDAKHEASFFTVKARDPAISIGGDEAAATSRSSEAPKSADHTSQSGPSVAQNDSLAEAEGPPSYYSLSSHSRQYFLKFDSTVKPQGSYNDQERYRKYKLALLAVDENEAEVLKASVECPPIAMRSGMIILYVAMNGEYRPGSNEERYYARDVEDMEMTREKYEAYVKREILQAV